MLKNEMYRGDTKYCSFNILNRDKTPTSIVFDDIYITVKKAAHDKKALIQKTLKKGDIKKVGQNLYRFCFLPEETNDFNFIDYVFDIELVKYNPPFKQTETGILTILPEVTHASNEQKC